VFGSHRLVLLNQPMAPTRLRGVASGKQAAVAAAVAAAVRAVNAPTAGRPAGGGGDAHQPAGGPGVPALDHPPRVTAALVDFARLVAASARDPGAPPDAASPVLEDDLHFGSVQSPNIYVCISMGKWERRGLAIIFS